MIGDDVSYIRERIPGYTGYAKFRDDVEKVNNYVIEVVENLQSRLAHSTNVYPLDVSEYLNISLKRFMDIVDVVKKSYVDIDVDVDVSKLVSIDRKIVEVLGSCVKIIDRFGAGLSLPFAREYSRNLFHLSDKLFKLVNERMELILGRSINRGIGFSR